MRKKAKAADKKAMHPMPGGKMMPGKAHPGHAEETMPEYFERRRKKK